MYTLHLVTRSRGPWIHQIKHTITRVNNWKQQPPVRISICCWKQAGQIPPSLHLLQLESQPMLSMWHHVYIIHDTHLHSVLTPIFSCWNSLIFPCFFRTLVIIFLQRFCGKGYLPKPLCKNFQQVKWWIFVSIFFFLIHGFWENISITLKGSKKV